MGTELPKEALRDIFVDLSGLPATRVLWDGEAKGFAGPTAGGETGHIILDCIATRRVGVDEELRDYEVEIAPGVFRTRITYRGQRVRTLNVRAECYGNNDGADLLEDIRVRLGSDEVCAALNEADLSLNGDEDVQNVGGASAGNRAVSFASLDVIFNHAVSRVVDVSAESGDTFIESVEIEEAQYES